MFYNSFILHLKFGISLKSGGQAMQYMNNPFSLMNNLTKTKTPFTAIITTTTTRINYKNRKLIFYSDMVLSKKYLYLFDKVKKEVYKNLESGNVTPNHETQNRSKTLYNRFNLHSPMEGEMHQIKDVVELDINKAYYQTAHNLGYISSEFYNECLNLPKPIRLILLGSIGTKKVVRHFNGIESISETKTDQILRNVWFEIVKKVDDALFRFAELQADNFLFYYVDGIYLKENPKVDFHKSLISKSYNFEFSTVKVDSIKVINVGTHNIVSVHKNGEIKTFNTSKLKVKA